MKMDEKSMSKVKIGVVEDEMVIAEDICTSLEELGYETTEPCPSYGHAIEMIEEENPDLLLIDIQLAGKKDGIDLAHKIRADYNLPFIFLTSNSDPITVERAKEVKPDAFLVKPFQQADLFTSIEIALSGFQEKEAPQKAFHSEVLTSFIFIKHKKLFHKIAIDEISHIMSDRMYLEVHTLQGKRFLTRSSLPEFMEKLPEDRFFRVHRRFIINVSHITAINSSMILMGETEVPLSKSYRDQLLAMIKKA